MSAIFLVMATKIINVYFGRFYMPFKIIYITIASHFTIHCPTIANLFIYYARLVSLFSEYIFSYEERERSEHFRYYLDNTHTHTHTPVILGLNHEYIYHSFIYRFVFWLCYNDKPLSKAHYVQEITYCWFLFLVSLL